VLGANALLLRCLADAAGTVHRCHGSSSSSSSAGSGNSSITSKLIRICLLPLLERFADPCPLVSAAAAAALASVCRYNGYVGGLSQLVAGNADYVVDGITKQLRNLSQYPRAPQLLAALLREAGVGGQLLTLLAEPLRAALGVRVTIITHQGTGRNKSYSSSSFSSNGLRNQ
jgi:hypothetical protein